MECPHCFYIDIIFTRCEETDNKMKIIGHKGFFFTLNGKLVRKNNVTGKKEKAKLIGCPDCNKTFIDF